MAEKQLTTQDYNKVEQLMGLGWDKDTAENLVSNKITTEEAVKLKKVEPQDEFDLDLAKKSKANIEKAAKDNQAIVNFSVEDSFNDFTPDLKDLVGASGVRYNTGAPDEVRRGLSFGINEPEFQKDNFKSLIKAHLVESNQATVEDVEKYGGEIKVDIIKFGDKSYNKELLSFKLPKQLGGDGKWNTVNKLGLDKGDLYSMAGGAIPFTTSTIGGILGSVKAPIVGTAIGAGLGDALGEFIRLQIGRQVYGLNSSMKEEDFNKYLTGHLIKRGLLTAGTTALFIKATGPIMAALRKAKGESMSGSALKQFLDSEGKIDPILKAEIEKGVKVLRDKGVPEEQIQSYVQASIGKMVPESQIFLKTDPTSKKSYVSALKKKAADAADVENKVLKKITGLDDVSDDAADAALNRVKSRAESIIAENKALVDDEVKGALQLRNRQLKSLDINNSRYNLDNFGVATSKFNKSIQNRLNFLDDQVDKIAKGENVKVNLNFANNSKEMQIFNKQLRKYTFDNKGQFQIQKLKTIPKGASKEQIAAINNENASITASNKFLQALNAPEYASTKVLVNDLKKGLLKLKEVTFGDAMRLKNMIVLAEEANAGNSARLGAFRTLKKALNNKIDDALQNNPNLSKAYGEYQSLLTNYQSSALKQIADDIGYGSSQRVLSSAAYKGESTFNKFISNNEVARENAVRLGKIMQQNQNFAQNNQIKSALLEHFNQKVINPPAGQKAMTFDDFIRDHGANYKAILGDEMYSQFVKGPGAAQRTFELLIKKQADMVEKGVKALPKLGTDLRNYTPTNVYEAIVQKGPNVDINLVKSAFGVQGYKDIQKVFLNRMFDQTKTDIASGVRTFEGLKLYNYLRQNQGLVRKVMGDEFYKTHLQLSKTLSLLQTPNQMGSKIPGLTDAANKAGLFVDIIAGPLNHKRLVMNRLGRIYDSFDSSGNDILLAMDYKKFVETAKKQFLSGNYPKWFDDLAPAQQTRLVDRIVKATGIKGKYKAVGTSPLLIEKYVQDKTIDPFLSDEEAPGEVSVPSTPIDIAVSETYKKGIKPAGKVIGEGLKKVYEGIKFRRATGKQIPQAERLKKEKAKSPYEIGPEE